MLHHTLKSSRSVLQRTAKISPIQGCVLGFARDALAIKKDAANLAWLFTSAKSTVSTIANFVSASSRN